MTIYLDSAMSPFHGCGRFDQWGSLTNGLRNFTRRWRSKFGFAVFDESGNPGFAVSCNCIRQLQIWLIWKVRTYPGELYQLRPFLCDLERFSTNFQWWPLCHVDVGSYEKRATEVVKVPELLDSRWWKWMKMYSK